MFEFNSDVDSIAKEVTDCMLRMYEDFRKTNPELRADYSKGSAIIAYRLGLDYFAAAQDSLHKGRIISGGTVTRAALENLIDLFYVYGKPDKYPKAYVESMEDFRKIMINIAAAKKTIDNLAVSRELKQANRWTGSSNEERVKASGAVFITFYDMLSYFSHPNPGSLTYIANKSLKEKQINLMQQLNCITALSLMKVVLNHTDVQSVTRDELEKIEAKLRLHT